MYHPNMRMLVLAGLLFTATLVNAQISNVTCSDGSTPQGRISVTGQGSVKSSPDSATIVLRVEVKSANATTARENGAVAVNATLAALSTAGVAADAISTSGLTLQPSYEYEPATGASKPTGVTFAQTFEVKLTNVTSENIGNVVDSVVGAGGSNAVQVSSVTTELLPETAKTATNTARQLAVADAVNTASVLSSAAGVALGPITSITDNSASTPVPFDTAPAADAASPSEKTPTQYVVGQYETTGSVSMEVAMCRVVS